MPIKLMYNREKYGQPILDTYRKGIVNILSLFSFFAFIVYLYLGIYTIRLDPQSRLNRTFFYLSLTFAVWAFAYVFFYSAPDKETCWFWYRISTIGWCFFPAVAMHFFLILTEKEKILQTWWIYPVLYLPAIAFLLKALTDTLLVTDFVLQHLGWCELAPPGSLWFWSYALYYSVFISSGLVIILIWGHNSDHPYKKRQAKVIALTAVPPLLLSATTDTILPAFNIQTIPSIAVILILMWAFGIWYAIVKHRLMILTPSIAADEIISKMLDILILVGSDGNILKVNHQATRLLGYSEDELIGKPLSTLIRDEVFLHKELPKTTTDGDHTFSGELIYTTKQGLEIPVHISSSSIKDKDGTLIGTVIVGQDIRQMKQLHREIAERKRMEETIRHQAYHDALTSLPNRILFRDRLINSLAQVERSRQRLAVLFLDLDNFKTINDSLGHTVGDHLLQEVAELLRNSIRESDTVARMGGDEYTILLSNIPEKESAAIVAQKIIVALKHSQVIDGYKFHITTSIGISFYPEDGTDADTLIKNADAAMYYAKERGRDNYQFYDPAMNIRTLEHMVLGNSLLQAIEREELEVHYQPMIDVRSGKVFSMEALVRWKHPKLGLLYPQHFIQLAEKSGLIIPIDTSVLRKACAQYRTWHEAGLNPPHMAVNLSTSFLQQPNLVQAIGDIIKESAPNNVSLVLELSEKSIQQNERVIIPRLQRLVNMGISLSLSGFVFGCSSLTFLKELPIHMLKIDRSFTGNLTGTSDDIAIIRTIIFLAKELGLRIIAEGIDTEEQMAVLCACGCDYMQGHLFSKPMPAPDMEKLLSDNKQFSICSNV